ncbi:MAG: hypothetical protein ACREQX_12400 [Candidatus Binataceae bacterium]
MKPNRLVTGLLASVGSLLLASSIAIAQPASQSTSGSSPTEVSGGHGSTMGGGMGMRHMEGMHGMHRMGMGCMGGMGMMPMMPMMHKDPKLMGRMMELRGEMMQTMGNAMIQHGKELQKGK